ncbi:MAG: hypothetical protein WA977_08475 [Halobacteriota archaeon]
MHAQHTSTPTDNISAEGNIKVAESDESAAQDLQNVTEIDGGILEYVRKQMHCRTITQEVRRQAALFQNEMDRMQGW